MLKTVVVFLRDPKAYLYELVFNASHPPKPLKVHNTKEGYLIIEDITEQGIYDTKAVFKEWIYWKKGE